MPTPALVRGGGRSAIAVMLDTERFAGDGEKAADHISRCNG